MSRSIQLEKCLVHFFWGIKVMIVDNSSSPPTATTPRKQSGYICTFNMVNTPELDIQLYWFKRDKVLTEKLIWYTGYYTLVVWTRLFPSSQEGTLPSQESIHLQQRTRTQLTFIVVYCSNLGCLVWFDLWKLSQFTCTSYCMVASATRQILALCNVNDQDRSALTSRSANICPVARAAI